MTLPAGEFSKWQPSLLMEWAKMRNTKNAYDLSCSGVPRILDLNELPGSPYPVNMTGSNYRGHDGLRQILADWYKASPDQVLLAQGASQNSFLISGSILSGGGTAIVETPVYEPILRSVEVWADRIIRLPRRREDNYQPDPDEFVRLIDPRTKLVMLTNLHNPTHVQIEPQRLDAIIKAADEMGATVVLDEVFMPMIEADYGKHGYGHGAVSINSLGKAWGLDVLRVGWAVGPQEIIQRAYRLNNLLGVNQPFVTEDLAFRILRNDTTINYLRRRTKRYLANDSLLENFVAETPQVTWVKPTGGLSALLELPEGTDDLRFSEDLFAQSQTVVFPGMFFECPSTLRVSFSDEPERIKEGLRRLKRALAA